MQSNTFDFNCPSCGQQISATAADSGATAPCPTCNTPLVIPAVAAPPTTYVSSTSPAQSQEHIFFQQGTVTVSKTRFIVGSQTYAMRNITSVKPVTYPPSRGAPIFLLLVGMLTAVVAFPRGSYGFGIFGLLLLGFAIFVLVRQRPTFGVFLTTSGGEIRAIQSRNWPFIQSVVAALNESIMSHA